VDCPDADTLNGLVANQLDADVRIQLLDHAGACVDCHGVLTAMIDVSTAPAPPTTIDRYVIERELGSGAMGVVFAARDPELDRAVAIKLLRGGASAARLKREAQLLARLHHPNVVAIHDVGEHAGETFIAMALVDGENLRAWLARPHAVDDKLRVIREAGRGLAAAHAAGLIHRDLKPDNIFIARDGSVLVGDFGLARDADEPDADEHVAGVRPPALTQTGMVLGTPAYMAPEHTAGQPCAASDQFSLCVTAWEALYGARPFAATTFGELREQIAAGPRAPTAPPIPARIRRALERGLRSNAAARFPSVDALLARLAPRRRRWPWIVTAVAGAGVAIALVIATGGHDGSDDLAAHCAPTQHLLDDVWGPTQRATMVGPNAELLDAYARDWSALRREVCMAPRPGQDARADCLDRAHEVLGRRSRSRALRGEGVAEDR
jgi:predicted Ser/Thr protein kinase